MYFNADSLLNKRNELKLLIDDQKTAVIGVSEVLPKNCKTKTQMAEICIEGYDCFENLSSAKRGVCIYTHVSLNATENRDMTNFDEEESVWCDVKLTENDRLLIGCIYRSPNSSISNDAKINKVLIHANNIGFSHVLITTRASIGMTPPHLRMLTIRAPASLKQCGIHSCRSM